MANCKVLDDNALNFIQLRGNAESSETKGANGGGGAEGRGSCQPIYATYSGDVRK